MIFFLNSLDRDLFESGHRKFVGFFLDFILNFEKLEVLKTYGPVVEIREIETAVRVFEVQLFDSNT